MENSSFDEGGEYNEISYPEDIERLYRVERVNVKNRGRRRARDEDAVKGLLDIVINNKVFKKKNVKNIINSRYYEQVVQELKERFNCLLL